MPIVNHNEVGTLQEVQMNNLSNMWVEWWSTLSKDMFTITKYGMFMSNLKFNYRET